MPAKEIESSQGIISLVVKRVAEFDGTAHLKVHCPELNLSVSMPEDKIRGSQITQGLLGHIWDSAEIYVKYGSAYSKPWENIARAKADGRSPTSIIKPKQKPQDTSCI